MLWGGRFEGKLNPKALKFSSSLSYDINLINEDIQGSKAHAEMLAKIGILSNDELKEITNGLDKIKTEWENESWIPDSNIFEDIHSAVEARLTEIIGASAGKLHSGRSRNDQIATDVKLWIKNSTDKVQSALKEFQIELLKLSEQNTETIIPGYTHLQRAQPVSFAFHLLAYVEMIERDKSRFSFVKKSSDKSPLGAGALAGSTLPLDREMTSGLLGFAEPTGNALDTVSDRDYIIDFLHSCSVGMMHLSRLCEELILWSTAEWNFIKIGDDFTTGSSLMPQKKNPDLAELIRGKTGRVYGNHVSLISTLKSLPLSYNRDMQEDKEPLFDSYFTYLTSVEILTELLTSVEVNKNRFIEELTGDFSLATDLADWLVLKGVPFRKAHHIVGKVVKKLEENGEKFDKATVELLKSVDEVFNESALECLDIKSSLKRKKTYGSPNPSLVENQIKYWKDKIC